MNWIETPTMQRLERYLDLVTFRHELISSNLANVDTPGYRTQDIDFESEMRRALVLAPGPEVGLELLPEAGFQNDYPSLEGIEPGLTLRELERSLLAKTLDATGGNRTRAAGMLGVSLRTVRNKIREFGLPPRRAA